MPFGSFSCRPPPATIPPPALTGRPFSSGLASGDLSANPVDPYIGQIAEIWAFCADLLLRDKPVDPIEYLLQNVLTFPFRPVTVRPLTVENLIDRRRATGPIPLNQGREAWTNGKVPCCVYRLEPSLGPTTLPIPPWAICPSEQILNDFFVSDSATVLLIVGDEMVEADESPCSCSELDQEESQRSLGESCQTLSERDASLNYTSREEGSSCHCRGTGKTRLAKWLAMPGKYIHQYDVLSVNTSNVDRLMDEVREKYSGPIPAEEKTLIVVDHVEPPHEVLHKLQAAGFLDPAVEFNDSAKPTPRFPEPPSPTRPENPLEEETTAPISRSGTFTPQQITTSGIHEPHPPLRTQPRVVDETTERKIIPIGRRSSGDPEPDVPVKKIGRRKVIVFTRSHVLFAFPLPCPVLRIVRECVPALLVASNTSLTSSPKTYVGSESPGDMDLLSATFSAFPREYSPSVSPKTNPRFNFHRMSLSGENSGNLEATMSLAMNREVQRWYMAPDTFTYEICEKIVDELVEVCKDQSASTSAFGVSLCASPTFSQLNVSRVHGERALAKYLLRRHILPQFDLSEFPHLVRQMVSMRECEEYLDEYIGRMGPVAALAEDQFAVTNRRRLLLGNLLTLIVTAQQQLSRITPIATVNDILPVYLQMGVPPLTKAPSPLGQSQRETMVSFVVDTPTKDPAETEQREERTENGDKSPPEGRTSFFTMQLEANAATLSVQEGGLISPSALSRSRSDRSDRSNTDWFRPRETSLGMTSPLVIATGSMNQILSSNSSKRSLTPIVVPSPNSYATMTDRLTTLNLENVIIERQVAIEGGFTAPCKRMIDARGADIPPDVQLKLTHTLHPIQRGSFNSPDSQALRFGTSFEELEESTTSGGVGGGFASLSHHSIGGAGPPPLIENDATQFGVSGYGAPDARMGQSVLGRLKVAVAYLRCFIVSDPAPSIITVEQRTIACYPTFGPVEGGPRMPVLWRITLADECYVIDCCIHYPTPMADPADNRIMLGVLLHDGSCLVINVNGIPFGQTFYIGAEQTPVIESLTEQLGTGTFPPDAVSSGSLRSPAARSPTSHIPSWLLSHSQVSETMPPVYVPHSNRSIIQYLAESTNCEEPQFIALNQKYVALASEKVDCMITYKLHELRPGGSSNEIPPWGIILSQPSNPNLPDPNITAIRVVSTTLFVGITGGEVQAFTLAGPKAPKEIFSVQHHDLRVTVIKPLVLVKQGVKYSGGLSRGSSLTIGRAALRERLTSAIPAVVTGSDDRTLSVIASETGEVLHSLRYHHQRVTDIATNCSMSHNIVVSCDLSGRVVVWSVNVLDAARKGVILWTSSITNLQAISLSMDGTWLACSRTYSPLILPISEWARTGNGQFHVGPIASMAISPDGNRLITGGTDGACLVWDLKDDMKLKTSFRKHEVGSKICCITCSPTSDRVASVDFVTAEAKDGGGKKYTLFVWSSTTGQMLHIIRQLAGETALFLPGDYLLVNHEKGAKILDRNYFAFTKSTNLWPTAMDFYVATSDEVRRNFLPLSETGEVMQPPPPPPPKPSFDSSSDDSDDDSSSDDGFFQAQVVSQQQERSRSLQRPPTPSSSEESDDEEQRRVEEEQRRALAIRQALQKQRLAHMSSSSSDEDDDAGDDLAHSVEVPVEPPPENKSGLTGGESPDNLNTTNPLVPMSHGSDEDEDELEAAEQQRRLAQQRQAAKAFIHGSSSDDEASVGDDDDDAEIAEAAEQSRLAMQAQAAQLLANSPPVVSDDDSSSSGDESLRELARSKADDDGSSEEGPKRSGTRPLLQREAEGEGMVSSMGPTASEDDTSDDDVNSRPLVQHLQPKPPPISLRSELSEQEAAVQHSFGEKCHIAMEVETEDYHYVAIYTAGDLSKPKFILRKGRTLNGRFCKFEEDDTFTTVRFLPPAGPDSGPQLYLLATTTDSIFVPCVLWDWPNQRPLYIIEHNHYAIDTRLWYPPPTKAFGGSWEERCKQQEGKGETPIVAFMLTIQKTSGQNECARVFALRMKPNGKVAADLLLTPVDVLKWSTKGADIRSMCLRASDGLIVMSNTLTTEASFWKLIPNTLEQWQKLLKEQGVGQAADSLEGGAAGTDTATSSPALPLPISPSQPLPSQTEYSLRPIRRLASRT